MEEGVLVVMVMMVVASVGLLLGLLTMWKVRKLEKRVASLEQHQSGS